MGLLWGSGLVLTFRAPWKLPEALASGLLLGGAALAKAEGLLLTAVVVAIACLRAARKLTAHRRPRPPWRLRIVRATGGALAVFLFVATLHMSWRAGIPNRYSETWTTSRCEGSYRARPRGSPSRFLSSAAKCKARDLERLLWLVPAVFVLGARAFRHSLARLLTYAIAGALSVYLAAYGASAWRPEDLIPKTWNRFLCQLSLPVFVLFAMALGRALRGFHRPAVA